MKSILMSVTLVFAQILAPRKQGDFFPTWEISIGRSKHKQVGQA